MKISLLLISCLMPLVSFAQGGRPSSSGDDYCTYGKPKTPHCRPLEVNNFTPKGTVTNPGKPETIRSHCATGYDPSTGKHFEVCF